MTEKYQMYLDMLHTRDQVLVWLAMMAMSVVLAREVLRAYPDVWGSRVHRVYIWIVLLAYLLIMAALIGMEAPGL
jgi:hypothetical protein